VSDVGDLLELLHGAAHRWQTLQCSVHHWRHTARSEAATERWAAASRGVSVMRLYADDPDAPRAETYEHRERIWIAKPNRFRQEHADDWVTVSHGRRWMSWSRHQGFVSNEGDPDHVVSDPVQSYAAHLDPATLIPQIEIEKIELPVVHVRPRAGDRHGPGLPHDADRHVLTLDERGIVVRLQSFVDGEPFVLSELVDPDWNEPIPDGVFTLEIPEGEEVVSPSELHAFRLTLEEAAERAGFPVYAIGELPDGVWRIDVHHHAGRGDMPEQVVVLYHRNDARRTIHAVEHAAGGEHPWARAPGASSVRVERDGTLVDLRSEDYDESVLEALASTLVRV
jgi:hypothetical protein